MNENPAAQPTDTPYIDRSIPTEIAEARQRQRLASDPKGAPQGATLFMIPVRWWEDSTVEVVITIDAFDPAKGEPVYVTGRRGPQWIPAHRCFATKALARTEIAERSRMMREADDAAVERILEAFTARKAAL